MIEESQSYTVKSYISTILLYFWLPYMRKRTLTLFTKINNHANVTEVVGLLSNVNTLRNCCLQTTRTWPLLAKHIPIIVLRIVLNTIKPVISKYLNDWFYTWFCVYLLWFNVFDIAVVVLNARLHCSNIVIDCNGLWKTVCRHHVFCDYHKCYK